MTTPSRPCGAPPGRNTSSGRPDMGLDTFAFDLAAQVLDCLCDQLALTRGGPVKRCCLYPGEEIAPMDECCQGMAAVRVYRIFPVTGRFPQQDFSPRNCAGSAYGVTLELTVYRCAATLDDRGRPPTCSALTDNVAVQMDDAAAMRRAIQCCYAPRAEDGEFPWTASGMFVEDDYNPVGPAGDCMGGRQRWHFPVYDVPCSCPPREIDRSC